MALLGSLARAACGATAKRLARHFPLQSLQLRPPLAPPASLPSSLRTDARRELSTSSGASPTHRPFSRLDVEACRRVKSGKHISPASNPGIRLEGRFLPEDEVEPLVKELLLLREQFGFETAGHGLAVFSRSGADETPAGSFDSRRVTGRPEGQENPALWGYGGAFDRAKVPARLAAFVDRIERCGSFSLGPLRDITVNYRGSSFFRLDPHVDPTDDGSNVFVMGLLSDVVLTFVPPEGRPPSGLPRRADAVTVARSSWTDQDIDVLLQQRSLIHFTGDARSKWGHAIRGGLEMEQPGSPPAIVDWWGKQDFYIRRSTNRISVVVAFGEKE